eukprot:TRINITY_DN18_c0_g1_i11.p1 TRINITY_DN18_c0_g1~~TRINITY_DN18_c0_g1_i11.p1  ORF type:complete len:131 (-),score=22.27 TRINITY_DN18_c0_g1_i11:740-1078(-)
MPSEEGTKLFVFGVHESCPRSVLEDEFTKIGPVEDVHITEKGYAFVTMSTAEDAKRAMRKLTGETVNGKYVKVEIAHGGRGRRGGEELTEELNEVIHLKTGARIYFDIPKHM